MTSSFNHIADSYWTYSLGQVAEVKRAIMPDLILATPTRPVTFMSDIICHCSSSYGVFTFRFYNKQPKIKTL
jgi:hypothetical protein